MARSEALFLAMLIAATGGSCWLGAPSFEYAQKLILPLKSDDAPCPLRSVAWVQPNGTVACGEACPDDTHRFLWYCGGVVGRTVKAVSVLADGGNDEWLIRLVYAALAGATASVVFVATARVASAVVLFASAYGTVAAVAWVGVKLVQLDQPGAQAAGTGTIIVAAMMLAATMAISGSLRIAASIARQGAAVIFMNPVILLGSLCVAVLRVATVVTCAIATLGIVANAASVAPVEGVMIRREIRWISEARRDEAIRHGAVVLITGAWLSVFWSHLLYISVASYSWRTHRGADDGNRRHVRSCARSSAAATIALGSLLHATTWVLAATIRYAQRRVREIDTSSRGVLHIPCAALQCCATACHAVGRVALPVVYASSVVHSTGFTGGFRHSVRISSSHPVLFLVVGGVSTVFVMVHGVASAAAGAFVSIAGGALDPFSIVACGAAARVAGALVVSPLPAAMATSLVVHVGALQGDDRMSLVYTHASTHGATDEDRVAKLPAEEVALRPRTRAEVEVEL